jgi:hypothetical protein
MREWKFLAVLILAAFITFGSVAIIYRVATKNSVVSYASQDDVIDIKDGFLERKVDDLILVKFPTKYLDSVEHYMDGFKIALVKVYGEKAKDAVIEPAETPNRTPYFVVTFGGKTHLAGLCYLNETKSEVVGVVLMSEANGTSKVTVPKQTN